MNRLVFSDELNSDLNLREAAAELHADLVLIYAVDTSFFVQDMFSPLTIVSLGLAPDMKTRVVSTASAILIDGHAQRLHLRHRRSHQNS